MKTVTLYTKPYCPLCHKAEQIVRSVQTELPFQLELGDITQDAELFEQYQYDVPVILLDGRELCRHRVEPEQLRRALTDF